MPILFPLLHAPTWRHFRYWAALLLAFSSFIPISEAAPTGTVSFDETLRLAVERAPSLNARQSQTQAAREEAIRAAALPDPQLTFGLDNWPVTGSQAFDWRAEDMTMKRIGLMQEFPARAKRQARQAVADRAVEQAEALSVTEQLAVRQVAASAWITLWAAEREQEVLSSQREQSALGIRLAEARLASGVGTAAEALAVQAAGLDLENRIDAARAKVEAARGTLARWLGSDPSEVGTVGVPPDLATLPIDAATLLASVDRQGPLLPWRSREAIAEAELALAAAEKRPDWRLAASYGQRDRSRSDLLMLEFSVDLPLFAADRQDRGIAARRAERDAVAASHEEARRMQVEAVHRALAEWNGLKRQVARSEQELLPLAYDRVQAAIAGYGGGGALQPWLEARRDEIELHIEHTRHVTELGRAWAWLAYLLPVTETMP
ncbi:TolC family protein [Iodidimonas sp. MBR-14]|jgi:outer membrane protein TolC|uniref:TolC family protein n=1 Tax=Iodidimonas sp. MBR-14 TaxID=3032319 RepID=UPI002482A055|nr:TolC family protein [Iodidimonas sp. MBR-14]